MEINRGDVFYVNRSETIGSEQRSGRPAIIVSNPECNEHSPVVEVVYLTSPATMINSAGDYVVCYIVARVTDGKDWLDRAIAARHAK